ALNNVRRHSRARRVEIRLESDEREVTMSVEDDGAGYAPSERDDRFGVTGMRERARSIGAAFSIASRHGTSGTAVLVRIPLAADAQS
ncbi:MAG TPA: ATP-binding protein, partial [Candidatus Baltobacteraceae bacterium]|nr:ATP-binding protein [Candidatus Baltobacteraceae bacterium]